MGTSYMRVLYNQNKCESVLNSHPLCPLLAGSAPGGPAGR